ncbi:MAG: hypothetical protein RR565_10130 [Erysipelothrix sp.]
MKTFNIIAALLIVNFSVLITLFNFSVNVYFEKQQRFGLRQTTEAAVRQHFKNEDDAKEFIERMLMKQNVSYEEVFLDGYHQYPNLIQLRITFYQGNNLISLRETMVEDKT